MRNFLKIATGIDFVPVLHELVTQRDLWSASNVRTWHPMSAHRGVDDLILRYNRFDPKKDDYVDKVCSSIDVVNYPAFASCTQTRGLVQGLMNRVSGEHLGRVMAARLLPGGTIPPHTDLIEPASEAFPERIPPAIYYERYHAVLKSQPGVLFRCGDEAVYMDVGDIWWFNNLETHEVANNSPDDRIHLIIDIHTATSPSC